MRPWRGAIQGPEADHSAARTVQRVAESAGFWLSDRSLGLAPLDGGVCCGLETTMGILILEEIHEVGCLEIEVQVAAGLGIRAGLDRLALGR